MLKALSYHSNNKLTWEINKFLLFFKKASIFPYCVKVQKFILFNWFNTQNLSKKIRDSDQVLINLFEYIWIDESISIG